MKIINKNKLEFQKFEYTALLTGYHSRDETMPRTFYYMIQVFSFFYVLLLGAKFITHENEILSIIIYIIFSIAGFISLLSFVLDMQGASSGKNALRERCTKLEKKMGKNAPQYWESIAHRKKYFIENMFKPYTKDGVRELRIGGFGYLKASISLLILWILIVFVSWFIHFNANITKSLKTNCNIERIIVKDK